MNSKFLIWSSFLIALLLHLALFSSTTFVFPIDPVSLKPKFFFLGPILSNNDITQSSTSKSKSPTNPQSNVKDPGSQTLKSINVDTPIRSENPFEIQAIKKPLAPQASDSQEKVTMKSTFETSSKRAEEKEAEVQKRPELDLNIQPYRSLQFQPSDNDQN